MHGPTPTDIDDITDALSLWRLLVAGADGGPLPPTVAINTFRRLHHGGEPGALDSALLLCTDWRWRRASAKVITGVVGSGILDDEDQDRLADALLWNEQLRQRASACDVLEHARTLPAREAAAVTTGAVRVTDELDPHEARTVLNAALAWGHKATRKAALERLLVDGEIDLASTLAQKDPDASIRQWARGQVNNTDDQGSLFE